MKARYKSDSCADTIYVETHRSRHANFQRVAGRFASMLCRETTWYTIYSRRDTLMYNNQYRSVSFLALRRLVSVRFLNKITRRTELIWISKETVSDDYMRQLKYCRACISTYTLHPLCAFSCDLYKIIIYLHIHCKDCT